jgi:hypothetical protein
LRNWTRPRGSPPRDEAEWDAEIERDFSPGGAGIELLEEMKADERAGKFRPLEEGRPKNS